MKKTILFLAVLGCLLILGGCSTFDMETAKGKKGNFEVAVVIEGGNIAKISVGNNEETPDKGGIAIAQLPDEIVATQSYDVDAVAGATVTSDGIKDAVARCLEEASK